MAEGTGWCARNWVIADEAIPQADRGGVIKKTAWLGQFCSVGGPQRAHANSSGEHGSPAKHAQQRQQSCSAKRVRGGYAIGSAAAAAVRR
jgi:hypothetical protein